MHDKLVLSPPPAMEWNPMKTSHKSLPGGAAAKHQSQSKRSEHAKITWVRGQDNIASCQVEWRSIPRFRWKPKFRSLAQVMLIQFYIGGQRHYVNTQITQPSRYPRQQLLLGNNLCYYLYFFINYFLPQVTKIREHEIIQGAWHGELLGRDFGLILSPVILPRGVIMDSWRSPMMVCKYSLKEVGGRLFKSRNIIISTYYLGVSSMPGSPFHREFSLKYLWIPCKLW